MEIEIYTTPWCPFCIRAKDLLTSKGAKFTEYDVASDPDKRTHMTSRASGGHTVPQIFIDDKHIGGCDDLYALENKGSLDGMLGS